MTQKLSYSSTIPKLIKEGLTDEYYEFAALCLNFTWGPDNYSDYIYGSVVHYHGYIIYRWDAYTDSNKTYVLLISDYRGQGTSYLDKNNLRHVTGNFIEGLRWIDSHYV